ncbi:E3 ubiquitin-protein ligase Arkadia-like [Vigna unguiculata]|uniref:E3 ubiquitin-protein ligase Arkadia-like n=1 Tax=Vigna unguiculata TaxID=3917 RepID=UPI001016629F|nr:E3 ubiquitin-protein ligase Arkadia-like [Vigna unguiculata]
MNPHVQGDSAGEGNASNQNYYRPRLSSETQERVLPLFPLFATEEAFPQLDMNLPQPGANNIRATTDVPFNIVAPESNIFSSSSSRAGTPPNPMENLDLCLNVGLSRSHGAAISSAAIPSSNPARSVHGSSLNSVNIPRKRSVPAHGSGGLHLGESSSMGQGTGEVKRLATESQVRGSNYVNPTPPSRSVVQQQHQFLGGRHVNPNNAGTPFPPPSTLSIGLTNTDDERRGYHAPIPSQASLPFNGALSHSQLSPLQPSHSVRPLSLLSSSFMSSSAPSVNNQTSSPCPHARVDNINMIPSYEHGNDMFGPVVTSTHRPNRFYFDTDPETARMALLYGLPRQFGAPESEPLQFLPGIAGNGGRVTNAGANTYHPLSATAWFLPQGSGGMNPSATASSSGTHNHHRPVPQIPSVGALRGFPSEIEHPQAFGTSQAFTGLSLETIMQFMEREIFLVVDGDDSEETKEKCPVCLEEFCRGEDIGKLHLCVHKFHFDCIKEWLMQRNLCPVCRRTALERRNDRRMVYILE